VNNNSSVTADFTTLQAAHNSSSVVNGDTLHLEASPNTYGALTCSKRLIILGTGYFLNENPNTQAVTIPSQVGGVTFNVGSGGSVIMGVDFEGNALNIFCHDIVIRRCKFSAPNGANQDWTSGTINVYYLSTNSNIAANNIIISENYGVNIQINYPSTGILITSNLITRSSYEGEATANNCLYVNATAVSLVQNNIFRRGRITANNSNFTNNIMYLGSFVGTGNLISNNLANASQFGNTSGNQENVVMSNVFVGVGPGISTDGQWALKVGSPALGAGYGGVDAGIFSGQSPYVLSGLPPIPAVYFFQNQPVGSNTDPIDVQIKVKSHN
jgi:hypothetical protein